jgi:hypothetical protein
LLDAELCCFENDVDGYLKATEGMPSFQAHFLRGQLKEAAQVTVAKTRDLSAHHGLVHLAALRANDKKLADSSWHEMLDGLKAEGQQERVMAEILEGKKPLNLAKRVPIDPNTKRVLLAVLAQRNPDQRAELLALAKKLDFHHDPISLCFVKVLQKP